MVPATSTVFTTLQLVASHRRLLRINRALLLAIALRNFIKTHSRRVKYNIFNINNVVLDNLYKVGQILGNQLAVKSIGRSYSWFIQLRQRKCSGTLPHLCRSKHPAQLLVKEVDVIKHHCTDLRYLLWPLSVSLRQTPFIQRKKYRPLNRSYLCLYSKLENKSERG